MYYGSLISSVRGHIELHGATCQVVAGKRVTDKTVSKAENSMEIRLPEQLSEFYKEMGNGFWLYWEADPNDDSKPFGSFQVPSLTELASLYVGWRSLALYSPEQAEKYGFPYTDNPSLAKQTAAKMWHWLPLIEEGNADQICLDLSAPSFPVIFNKHDWLDGGSGKNGHLLARSWRDFVTAWAKVCFQPPKSMWWPSCFRDDGVAWDGDQFCEPFIMT